MRITTQAPLCVTCVLKMLFRGHYHVTHRLPASVKRVGVNLHESITVNMKYNRSYKGNPSAQITKLSSNFVCQSVSVGASPISLPVGEAAFTLANCAPLAHASVFWSPAN